LGGVTPALDGLLVRTAGDVSIGNLGALTVTEGIRAPGNINLEVLDNGAFGENGTLHDAIVQANVTIASAGGGITLRANGNLTIDPTARLRTPAPGTITLMVDLQRNPFVGNARTATFSGASLEGAASATVSGDGGDETFDFSPSPEVPILVQGFGG